MKKSNNRNTYILYTCTFLLLLPVIFYPFISAGKSFVWYLDGIDQHYPALLYYGKLLRGLFTGKGFPMVDFHIGMGFDTLTTLNFYAIGDPISLLSVFMTSKNSIFIYNALILLRFYLSGISFILLMHYFKKEGLRTVLGALIYVFCGYCFYAGLRHPFFMNPMIYLPLIIIGVEQVLRDKKPYLMIVMIFISTISNFYFLYELTIITVIYIIFRYITVYRKNYKNVFTGFLRTGLKTGGYYLLGAALASFVFIPVVYAFSLNGRLDAHPGMVYGYLHYGIKYYKALLQDIFAADSNPKHWASLSFASISAVSLAILIANRKFRKLQVIYLFTFIGLSIPAFGYFMNGFAYDANRFSFMISLLIAITFTLTYDKIFDLSYSERFILILITAVYGISAFSSASKPIVKYTFFALLIIIAVIFLLQLKWFKDRTRLSKTAIYALVIFSIGINGYGFFSKHYNDYTSEFLSYGGVRQISAKGELSVIPELKDNSFYRIDTYGEKEINGPLTVDYHAVSAYYSLMNGDVTAYLKDLEDLNQRAAYRFDNLDNRTILDTLAGVKYFISTDKAAAPFGFNLLKEVNSGPCMYYLFQNSNSLPIGYTYENYMLRSDYDKLSALEKQNAMLNAVILDQNTNYAQASAMTANSGIQKLDVKVVPDADVTLQNNVITVKKPDAAITLDFKSKPNSETYVRLGNFNINKKEDTMIDFYAKGSQGAKKLINVRSPYYNSYFGKNNYLINIGYSAAGETQAVITFPHKGIFSFDSIDVYSVDMSNYADQVKALNSASLKNVTLNNNSLQGDITLEQKGIMALSIPYSKGFSAYVDGVKKKLLPANVMYMSLPLDAGSHHILLKYETPYLKLGILVSCAASLILIGIIIIKRISNKHKIEN